MVSKHHSSLVAATLTIVYHLVKRLLPPIPLLEALPYQALPADLWPVDQGRHGGGRTAGWAP